MFGAEVCIKLQQQTDPGADGAYRRRSHEPGIDQRAETPEPHPLGDAEMSDPPRIERPYQIDDQWSRAVFLRRTGQVASFLAPHLRAGMRLIDCGCGPGSITIDLARIVAPGDVVGIDRRQASLSDARKFARERGVANVAFEVANVYQLPFPDRSFDAAFACALLHGIGFARSSVPITPDARLNRSSSGRCFEVPASRA